MTSIFTKYWSRQWEACEQWLVVIGHFEQVIHDLLSQLIDYTWYIFNKDYKWSEIAEEYWKVLSLSRLSYRNIRYFNLSYFSQCPRCSECKGRLRVDVQPSRLFCFGARIHGKSNHDHIQRNQGWLSNPFGTSWTTQGVRIILATNQKINTKSAKRSVSGMDWKCLHFRETRRGERGLASRLSPS